MGESKMNLSDIVNKFAPDKKVEDVVQENSTGMDMLGKIKSRIESKSVKSQLDFYKSLSDKLIALFMEATPSAEPKFAKFMRDIKSSFSDMLAGEEGNLEIDDVESEETEESELSKIVGDDFDDEDFSEVNSEDDFEDVEVEEASKKVKKKSPYAEKIAKLKEKIAALSDKKKNIMGHVAKAKENHAGASPDLKARAKKQIAQAQKAKKVITDELIGMKGALNTFRVLNKKWKEKQKTK